MSRIVKPTTYELANDVIRRAGLDPCRLTDAQRFDVVMRHVLSVGPGRLITPSAIESRKVACGNCGASAPQIPLWTYRVWFCNIECLEQFQAKQEQVCRELQEQSQRRVELAKAQKKLTAVRKLVKELSKDSAQR